MAVTALLVPGWLQADQWTKTFRLTGTPELRIEANEANISIKAADRADVEALVTTSGWKISDSDVRVLENSAGNVLELDVVTPRLRFGFARRTVKLELQVPREAGCEIKSGIGNVAIEGVKGRIVLAGTTGNFDGTGLDGKLEAATNEGKMRVRGRFDLLTLRAGFGQIDAEAAAGSRMFSTWRISTEDGDITLRLPSGFKADLDAQGAGRIKVEMPVKATPNEDESKLRGKMNGGGELLIVRSDGGKVRILPDR